MNDKTHKDNQQDVNQQTDELLSAIDQELKQSQAGAQPQSDGSEQKQQTRR